MPIPPYSALNSSLSGKSLIRSGDVDTTGIVYGYYAQQFAQASFLGPLCVGFSIDAVGHALTYL